MKRADKEAENALLTQVLYEALAEPIGLLIRSSDPARLRQRLYQLRANANDPELAKLQFTATGIVGADLMIIKVKRK